MHLKKKILTLFLLTFVALFLAFQLLDIPLGYTENTSDILEANFVSNKSFSAEELSKKMTLQYRWEEFELPIEGATGYSSIELPVKEENNEGSNTLHTLSPGDGFRIIDEREKYWLVEANGVEGWVEHRYTFINLPDVIPSIVYDNTNAYSSVFRSSEEAIPNITGKQLYDNKVYNERLNKEEFIMPVLYHTAKNVYRAQVNALNNNDTLILNEAFRPYSVQRQVVNELTNLSKLNKKVSEGISKDPWGIQWFIASGLSNHQMGYAIDASLASIESKKEIQVGHYTVVVVDEYTEYTMPSAMHELSVESTVFTEGVTSKNDEAWRHAQLNHSMTEGAIKLQDYTTAAGLTPLASEWWHFNDLHARDQVENNHSKGQFTITDLFSTLP